MTYLFAQVLAASEEPPSGVDLILPETGELIAGIVAFAIVFLVVWKFALPALNKMLAERQAAITGQLTEAEKAKQEAESLLGDYRKQLADAKAEANSIIDQAREQADGVRRDMIAKAEADAAEIATKAKADLQAERQRAEADLKAQVASLSLELAQKVVAGTVDRDTQKQLVDRYIDDLGSLN